MNKLCVFTLSALGLLLTACGGGSENTGGTPSANISQDAVTVSVANQESVGKGATLGVSKAISSNDGDFPFGAALSEIEVTAASKKAMDTIKNLSTLPAGFKYTENCTFGGTIEVDFVGVSENATSLPDSGVMKNKFTNCRESGMTMNGTLDVYYSGGADDVFEGGDYRMVFNITYSGMSYADDFTFTGEINCSNDECTMTEIFSEGGVSYKVENASVSGDASGWDVDAKIYMGEQGYVTVSSTDITLDTDGNICSGSISVTDSSQSAVMSIDFYDCGTFTVTFDGQSKTYDQ